jgi:hypothetical protein
MRSRLTKTVASMDGNDVAPLVSASALRDATNVSAQNAVAQMMSRAKPDIIFSYGISSDVALIRRLGRETDMIVERAAEPRYKTVAGRSS